MEWTPQLAVNLAKDRFWAVSQVSLCWTAGDVRDLDVEVRGGEHRNPV